MIDEYEIKEQMIREARTEYYAMVPLKMMKAFGQSSANLLCYLYLKYKSFNTEDGWFYRTRESIEEDIGMKLRERLTAEEKLISLGILEKKTVRDGMNNKNYYRINFVRAEEKANEISSYEKFPPSFEKVPTVVTKSSHIITRNKEIRNKEPRIPSLEKNSKEGILSHSSENQMNDEDSPSSKKIYKLRSKRSIIRSRQTLQNKKKIIDPIEIPSSLSNIWEHWLKMGFRKPADNTKTMKDNINFLISLKKGTMFTKVPLYERYKDRAFTDHEIKMCIDRLCFEAFNSMYYPVNESMKKKLRQINLCTFIYSPFTKTKSQFIRLLENPPKPVSERDVIREDPNPEVTNVIKRFYVNKVLGGIDIDLNQRTKNDFIVAADKAVKFYQKHREKISMFVYSPKEIASFLCKAIEEEIEDKENGAWTKVTSGWFSSDTTFERRLPAYMKYQGMFSDNVF